MGLFGKHRNNTESSDGSLSNHKPELGFIGSLYLVLPMVRDWNVEYHIDHESANFTVDLDAFFDDVSFSSEVGGDEQKAPSYLQDWTEKWCALMINSYPTPEDFELRRTKEQLGFGWREPNNRFVIKIYLSRTEFRDVVAVLNQDHLRHGEITRDAVFGWLEQRGFDRTEELDGLFTPSERPRIRLDIKNLRLAEERNFVDAELWFDVCRIYT